MSRRRNNKIGRLGCLFTAVFFLALFLCLSLFWRGTIQPSINSVAEMKASAIVSRLVNSIIRENYKVEAASELLIIQTNSVGEIELIRADTYEINRLITGLTAEIQKDYSEIEAVPIEVPLGSAMGSQALSQAKAKVELKILPMAISSVDYHTEFEEQGINQTKYKVYAVFESSVKLLAPFSEENITVCNTVLLAEAVIVGRVPQTYVVVPEDEIMDAF